MLRVTARWLVLVSFAALLFSHAAAQTTFPVLLAKKPAVEYQDQLMLFGQFVGAWTFEGVEYHDDGSRVTDKGEIYFQWVLQGKAIQDVWRETKRSDLATKIYGTTVRFFDPKSNSWRVIWIEPGLGVVTILKGLKVGDEIVITGQTASGSSIRWIFSDIKRNSFRWHADKSSGKDWRTYEELWAHRKL